MENVFQKKNKDSYVEQVREVVYAVINTMFPYEVQHVLEDFYNYSTDTTMEQTNETDSVLQEALIESYGKADTWQLKRQMLSILAKTMHYKSIIEKIPSLTEYRYYKAKNHSEVYGCALPPPCNEQHRQRMDPKKLDIFLDFITSSHIIKDLPFGERKLRLSIGKVVETPNVIRCMDPAAIIQQFKQYCAENDDVPLGDSAMFKILAECSATVRRAYERIDDYVAEGGRAFLDICSVVEELCQVGALTKDKMKEYIEVAQECKRYLKTDYKVHITESSSVLDHSRMFPLSDKLGTFGCKCEHEHDIVCVNCEQIHELLSSLTNLILVSDLKEKEENRDNYEYKLSQAQSNIINWKTHIVRTSHQEKAKSDIMANMGPNEVFLVLDWAMKYLPRRYREDESNWFAKRGLSWHIGVAFRSRKP